MKAKRLWLILPLLVALFGAQCKKESNLDPNGLPKATQTGRNIFACKVNGENWIAEKNYWNTWGGVTDDTLSIHGDDKDNGERFTIVIRGFGSQSSFNLTSNNQYYALYSGNEYKCYPGKPYDYRPKSSDGKVDFTRIDREARILSGIFWFTIPTPTCGELKITEGRFDIRY